MSTQHPRYADGAPILLGDTVTVPTLQGGRRATIITSIRETTKGEVWLHTGQGGESCVIYTAKDIEAAP